MIAAVALGLVIGLALGALGGGGSILAVPVLVHIAGQSATAAGVGSISHARAGNVRWGSALAFVATGVGGSWAGASLNGRVDEDLLLLGFSGLVLLAAHRMLTACPSCTNVGEALAVTEAPVEERVAVSAGAAESAPTAPAAVAAPAPATPPPGPIAGRLPSPAALARIVIAGTAVGFLTGLFGVGGGFVIVPALTLALGLSMPVAIGTSLVVIVGNALVALGFRGLDAVDWELAVPFTITMLIGSLVGSMVGHRLPPLSSLRAFAGLLVLVAIANGAVAAIALAT